MREILFRGKRTDNYQWIKGYFVEIRQGSELIPHIIPFNSLDQNLNVCPRYRVFCETVGQYTGLTDKNGKKIFEGDILYDEYNESNCLIKFDEGSFCFVDDNICQSVWGCSMLGFEVIGNIHDNPEL